MDEAYTERSRFGEYRRAIDEVRKTVFIDTGDKCAIQAVYEQGLIFPEGVKLAMDECLAIVNRLDHADDPIVRVDKFFAYVAYNVLRHANDERNKTI